ACRPLGPAATRRSPRASASSRRRSLPGKRARRGERGRSASRMREGITRRSPLAARWPSARAGERDPTEAPPGDAGARRGSVLAEEILDARLERRRDLVERRDRRARLGALDLRKERDAQVRAPRHLLEGE